MYIRELTVDELDQCAPFGVAFHEEVRHPEPFSLDAFLEHWHEFYRQGIGVIFGLFEDDDVLIGGIGGVLAKDITSGTLHLNETFWYVQKDKRHSTGRWALRLVHRIKMWGLLRHARRLHMVHFLRRGEAPNDEALNRIYTQYLKMTPFELGYIGPIGV